MSQVPDFMSRVSEALSDVMDELGVNETVVQKRRRTPLLGETIKTMTPPYLGGLRVYIVGSQCYTLMKMILKTYINPYVENVVSSFMCKNVLFFCIANSSHDWHTGSLLSYLHLCLFMLKECVKQRNCPHFIIPENNLLVGRMTDTQRGQLLNIINNFMNHHLDSLIGITIDNLGNRLNMKFMQYGFMSDIPSFSDQFSVWLLLSQSCYEKAVLAEMKKIITKRTGKEAINRHESLEVAQEYLYQTYSTLKTYLKTYRENKDNLQYAASELLLPFISSVLGSVLASIDINATRPLSCEALAFLEAGKESDALSGRLKLVSVLFCTGDTERVEHELKLIQSQFNISYIRTVCGCTEYGIYRTLTVGSVMGVELISYYKVATKYDLAVCTRFLHYQTNSVPCELRYEILRTFTEDDRLMRTAYDSDWMDTIVVDSIPYLYFLQYKTCRYLKKTTEADSALSKLKQNCCFDFGRLRHKETALNLLGQCFEQEHRQTEAFQCYILSLKHRRINNAVRFLLCIQLLKLWKQYNAYI